MERSGSDLETKPNKHQRRGNIRQNRQVTAVQDGADCIDIGGAGCAKHERNTIQEKGGSERSEQEILQRRLAARCFTTPKSSQNVG